MKKIELYVVPSLGSLLFLLVLFGALSLGPRMMNMDGDLGRHLTIGQYILTSGQIPLHDLFSHTMNGTELTPHEWLAQVIFALSYRWLGLNGPVWVAAAAIAAALYIAFRSAVQRSQSVLLALLVAILALAASSLHWLTRPHIFTFLFLALWMVGMERLRHGKFRGWYWMPLLMLFWANLHGAFIAGFMLCVLYGAGFAWEKWVEAEKDGGFAPGFGRYFLWVGGLALLATMINPVGPSLWATSIGYLGNSYLVNHTAEYLSPDFHQPNFWPFLLILLLGLGVFGLSAQRRKAVDVLVFTAWGAMSLISSRNIPLFSVLTLPILADAGKQILNVLASKNKFFRRFDALDGRLTLMETSLRDYAWPAAALFVSLLIFSLGLRLDAKQSGNRFDPAVFPVDAVTWLEINPPPGKMFNYFPWGGYLLYRDWPRWLVFIDGQTDFYGEKLTRSYERILNVQDGWQAEMEQYQVGWVLLPPGERLAAQLESDTAWHVVYRDKTAVVISKK